jgi:hypothetical protein
LRTCDASSGGSSMGVDLDKWIEKVKRCEYLAEEELKALCEYVSCASHTPLPLELLVWMSWQIGLNWPSLRLSGEGDSGRRIQRTACTSPCDGKSPLTIPVIPAAWSCYRS